MRASNAAGERLAILRPGRRRPRGPTGSAISAKASRRSASARAPNVAIAAASADSGPGAASAAFDSAAISAARERRRPARRPDRSWMGSSDRRCRRRCRRAPPPARSAPPRCRPPTPAPAPPPGSPRAARRACVGHCRCADRAWQGVSHDSPRQRNALALQARRPNRSVRRCLKPATSRWIVASAMAVGRLSRAATR